MSIRITYKITPYKEYGIYDILDVIKKDISWGTYADSLDAVAKTIGNNNYKKIAPEYKVDNDSLDEGKETYKVDFIFKDKQFCFEQEGLNHFIGTIAGDIIRNRMIKEIIIDDFEMDDYSFFPGPLLGNEQLKSNFFRKTIKSHRPIMAFSIKPRLGFTTDEYKKIVIDACKAKIDLIEDDERLVSPKDCSFIERVNIAKEIIQSGTDSKISINLTSNPHKIKEKVEQAYEAGIRVFKLDIMVVGFDTLLYLRNLLNEKKENCIITVFPDVYGNVYRCLSRQFILKMSRLCGADIIYPGSPFPSRMGELIENNKPTEIWFSKVKFWMGKCKNMHAVLLDKINNAPHIKSCLPTITHDINPQMLESLIYLIKMEINDKMEYAFFIGGGISSMKCNYSIAESTKLWMKIVSYAGNFNLTNYCLDNFYQLERYDEPNYKKCLEQNDFEQIHTNKTVKYNYYDRTY